MLDFIEDFKTLDAKFDDRVLMTPHFKFFSCQTCSQDFVSKHCFAGGKYCGNQNIQGNTKYSISGREILIEDLRQICIHKLAYEKDVQRKEWWDYMDSFHRFCYGSVNEDCSRLAHGMNFLEYDTTMNCVNGAFRNKDRLLDFKVDQDLSNKVLDSPDLKIDLLDEEKDYFNKYGPSVYPGIVINNQTFRGQIEIEAVFNALCAGFWNTPSECQKYLNTNDINNIDLLLMRVKDDQTGHSSGFVVLLVLTMMVCFLIMLFFYRRSAKRQMKIELKQQVESAVN